jgi:hypothetical protein
VLTTKDCTDHLRGSAFTYKKLMSRGTRIDKKRMIDLSAYSMERLIRYTHYCPYGTPVYRSSLGCVIRLRIPHPRAARRRDDTPRAYPSPGSAVDMHDIGKILVESMEPGRCTFL